ncbi:MAG: CDP-diacylglycerol--serine O-phosphatidyltransferase [Rhodothermales bacterium]|nr:CDP-diacylglycerol--serine O-phosphatidyltransferase [Rhodothermales bacterium]MBO6780216.1 CDP-diacylglycerol--serine O-phosphatidyltransferase [Rhodothermales bacterium]
MSGVGKQRRIRQRLETYRAKRGGRVRRRLPPTTVPSFFTLMNLFSGFLAIIQASEGRFENAAWLIVLAAFFDLLDGMMARLTNGSSLFGVELDSLSDIVSFGVAPAFLVHQYALGEFGLVGLVVSALPAICGAVRLARFNVNFDGEKKPFFEGMPIPGQAMFIVAVLLNASWLDSLPGIDTTQITFLGPIIVLMSVLMISPIRFESMPKPSAEFLRAEPRKGLIYVGALVLMLIVPREGVLICLSTYVLVSIWRTFSEAGRAALRSSPVENAENASGDGKAS